MKETKRPWGKFLTFAKNQKCTVKILEVNPGESLSLQKHKLREEHWYFLDPGIVQIGNSKKKIAAGKEVIIKKNKEHRLVAGKNKTRVLEISFGNFSEKDEVRLEDKYARR
ncbi:MAG TPA: phosphomannose isomerase type II C-terminal cupin domain [archaeon]|jgi:mannose-6-phosphate isomerase|nr:phosphomannose isomerase type II C-terminal cupin domain [archaeon]